MDPATLAIAVTPFLLQAAEKLGEKVWDKASDVAADEAAGFGRRLLAKLLHRRRADAAIGDDIVEAEIIDDVDPDSPLQTAVATAVRDVVDAPTDADAQAALRLAVRKLLAADPVLLAEVQRSLEHRAPGQKAGDRAVVVGGSQSQSVNVTGDGSPTNVTYGGPAH